VLYVDEGDVLTSAGVAAGIDLCLHLVRRDHGPTLANAIARRMVVAPHRDGGQAQFVERPLPEAGNAGLEPTRAWMLERLDQPITVADMARHAAYAQRSFARRFQAETGASPLRWLIGQRVLEAQRLLETTALPVEEVAGRCGFGTAASLRQHFGRHVTTTPTAYRARFRARPRAPAPASGGAR
jgi:transcriptional regulator GlxA family with amidase domain